MTTIAVDGLNEEAFRRSIEGRLRQGLTSEAIAKLRSLLRPYAGPGGILPERFITIKASDLTLTGWESLAEVLVRHDRPGWPITAVSIAFGWPGEDLPQPDGDGRLAPPIETAFFSDESFPFSQSAREDLLDGYSYHGCSWSDDSVANEPILGLEGIDDLHGALALLEARLLDQEEPDEDEIRAGSLGACLLSALLFQAVALRIERDGLPRPLCVLSGSNGVYPYFDAPVAGMPAEVLKAGEEEDEATDRGVPGPRYSSLLVTGIPRARKRAVLVLDETEHEKALRTADLRNLAHGEDQGASGGPSVPPIEPGPEYADGEITPPPLGPLMTKNPDRKAWDFRDMLGTRDGEVESEDKSQAESLDDDWPEIPATPLDGSDAGLPEDDFASTPETGNYTSGDGEPEVDIAAADELQESAAAEPLPPQRFPRLPLALPDEEVRPGFELLEDDDDLHARLKALEAARRDLASPTENVPAPQDSGQIEPAIELPAPETAAAEPLPPVRVEPAYRAEHPVWPLGIGWLEAEESQQTPEAPAVERRPGLAARFLGWLLRRR